MNLQAPHRRSFSGDIEIAGNAAICDPTGALYFPEPGLLVVSDLHLEKGSSFARRGQFMPPYDTAATLLRLQSVIAAYAPRIVLSLGDSFHDGEGAERLPAPFRQHLEALMTGREWIWVAGNHDPNVPSNLPGLCAEEIAIAGLSFKHAPSPGAVSGEVAGHLHPCARIVQRGRSVRRRCFAYDGARLVMPAFGAFTGSLNVMDRAYRGLFAWERFTAYMLGDTKVYPIAGSLLRPG